MLKRWRYNDRNQKEELGRCFSNVLEVGSDTVQRKSWLIYQIWY